MILKSVARMLIQEHRYRSIRGRVLCLGPQIVPMHRGEVDALFARRPGEGGETMRRRPDREAGASYVSDGYLFEKFGVERLDSLECVERLGATIIHDLNRPVPAALHEQFDFILDGGKFDRLVNLGIAFESIIRMLKPGGRVFHYDVASGHLGAAYVAFGPDLFFDYYVVNGFADCKVYVARETGPHPDSPWDVFYVPEGRTKQLNSRRRQMVIAIAEKGAASLADRVPVEHACRDPELRAEFAAQRREVLRCRRPVLRGDRVLGVCVREWLVRTRLDVIHGIRRYRAGKFTWARFRRELARHKAGTGYAYVGRF